MYLAICVTALAFMRSSHGLSRPENKPYTGDADFDIYTFSTADKSNLNWYSVEGTIESTGRPYYGHVATFEPSFFEFYPPTADGCTDYIKTSVSSKENWNCEYATNGGFFTWDTTQSCLCEGNLISNGEAITLEGMNKANFAITSDNKILTGFITSSTLDNYNISTMMSGSGWLVRNGKSYVANSADLSPSGDFVLEKAPRTSVGVFANSTMILFEVDGEEDIEAGPDLYEMAELLVGLGVHSAVNIDGGGSSVSVYDGEVVSLPTCSDTSTICEREVQSITCVRK